MARFAAGGDLVIDNVAHVSVWPMDLRAWVRFACQVTVRDLTRAEWSDLLPDRPYRHVCPQSDRGAANNQTGASGRVHVGICWRFRRRDSTFLKRLLLGLVPEGGFEP